MKYLFLFLILFTSSLISKTFAQQYPEMIAIQGGTFTMGNSSDERDGQPLHSVTLRNFSMSKTETTVLQWKFFCEDTKRKMPVAPAWGWIDNHPIVNISSNEAVEYTVWLSKKTGKNFRLPTEAEWEYAARNAGSKNENFTFSGSSDITEVGWFMDNSNEKTFPIAQKKPNEYGLFDMTGNVSEMCLDRYGSYSSSNLINPQGPQKGLFRIIRGGSWYNTESYCSNTFRDKCAFVARFDYMGFRVVEY